MLYALISHNINEPNIRDFLIGEILTPFSRNGKNLHLRSSVITQHGTESLTFFD